MYCLKKMSYPNNRLIWMDTVLLELRRKGFRTIAWRNPSTFDGKVLLVWPNPKTSPYILTPWLKGRTPDPASEQDMYVCAQALARFHRTGQSVNIPSSGAMNLLGKWPNLIQSRMAALKRHILRAKTNSAPSGMDVILCKYSEELLHRAEQALKTFRQSDYDKLCANAKRTGAYLCHADSGPKNFVMTSEGPSLIDFETLRIDLRVYDLYRLIRLAGKKNGWDFSIAQAVLNGYNSVSKLEPFEYELLGAWLGFPQKAYKTLTRYELAGAAERAELSKKLEKVLIDEQRIPVLLRQLSDYAAGGESNAPMDLDQ
jgi:CotS family spore coat protein